MDDKKLIRACQNGDRQAFDDLIRMYYPYVSGFLLRTCRDEELAGDLTQDTFLNMIRSIDSFDRSKGALFGTWLITIARNLYTDYLRRNHAIPADMDLYEVCDPNDMETGVLQNIAYEDIIGAISRLPKEQSEALLLRYVQDLTLAQIAGALGIPEKTVKSRIHDGTVKLRRMLGVPGKE